MPAPSVNRLQKAVQGITIGVVKDTQARQRKILEDGLQERTEEIRVSLNGVAYELPEWVNVSITFRTNFIDATGQRDSPFTTPHFTFGSYLISSGPASTSNEVVRTPVAFTATVIEWKRNGRSEIVGATLAVAAYGAMRPTKFRGEVHCTFTGYGQPRLTGIEDDA